MRKGKERMHFIVLIPLAIFFLSTVSHATVATYEQHIAKGVAGVEAADYRVAAEEFRAALKEKPLDPTATLYLGIALNRSGDREAETILKQALVMEPSDPRTNIELGIYYFRYSMYGEAKDYFENTIKLSPGTEFSAKAREYLTRIKEGGLSKPWAINYSLGGQYDSNVVLNPSGNPLPQGISKKSDWSAVFVVNGRYHLIKEEKTEASVGFNFYQNVHATLADFNITQPVLDVTAAYAILPWLQLRGLFNFEYVWVGGNRYGYDYMAAPSVVITEAKGFSTVIEYRYRRYTFIDSELFFDNSQRSGPDNYIGITQNISLNPSVQARLTYSHDSDSTRDSFWHYRGDKGVLGLSFALPEKIFLNLDAEYYVQRYEGKDPETGANRKDKIFTGAISATKVLSDVFSVTLAQLYTRDNSNLAAFDYKRAVTSLFVNARF
jgi:hypothetical protein